MRAGRPHSAVVQDKMCGKCKRSRPIGEFYFRRTEGRYNTWCRECTCSFQVRRWKDRKRKAVELLGGKCGRCGYDRNLSALQFHHLDQLDKDCDWNKLRLRSWGKIVL